MAGSNSQETDAKHGANANLLLPVQVERVDLRQRNANHEEVETNADTRIRPSHSAGIDTRPHMLLVPAMPVVRDWLALEDGHEQKDEAEGENENDGAPESTAHPGGGEDPKVEEEEGQFAN